VAHQLTQEKIHELGAATPMGRLVRPANVGKTDCFLRKRCFQLDHRPLPSPQWRGRNGLNRKMQHVGDLRLGKSRAGCCDRYEKRRAALWRESTRKS
jgi:hypothetical protein